MKRLKENRWFLLAAVLLCCLLCFLLLSGRSAGGSGTSEEKRIAQVLSAISGAGKVEVAVYYNSGADGFSSSAPPVGAVVVAEGADDLEVRLSLIRAVRTILGQPEAAVDVFSMEAGRGRHLLLWNPKRMPGTQPGSDCWRRFSSPPGFFSGKKCSFLFLRSRLKK